MEIERAYPIVYVRGYAGSQTEVEDTVATPYMGFNLGSTKIRQTWQGKPAHHVFESPLIRLMKEHAYRDVYEDGAELAMDRRPPMKSVWIYRYYDVVSKELDRNAARPEMEDYAIGLDDRLETMRDRICGPPDSEDAEVLEARERFKVYLVAHSMGGLVCRCYLQHIWPKAQQKRADEGKTTYSHPPVDKVFTYATPHGGIDLRGLGNLPAWLTLNNLENFAEDRMRAYLNNSDESRPVHALDERIFPSERFFCLVGTNYRDYDAAGGAARKAVGGMSDGLVQIKNAYVEGAPRAFVHRSHSGHYGIVNSEEGYQNLRRFLFGDVRVDMLLQGKEIRLPDELEKRKQKESEQGSTLNLNASYHVEAVVRVRGARWDLHRRTVQEESAKFVNYERFKESQTHPIHLATTYLLSAAARPRTDKEKEQGRHPPLGFSVDLAVVVPEYEVDGFLWTKDHYEGGYLYRQKINLELVDGEGGAPPTLYWGLDSATPNRVSRRRRAALEEGPGEGLTYTIPLEQDSYPGLLANLILKSQAWS